MTISDISQTNLQSDITYDQVLSMQKPSDKSIVSIKIDVRLEKELKAKGAFFFFNPGVIELLEQHFIAPLKLKKSI